jgi:hypothetical protein
MNGNSKCIFLLISFLFVSSITVINFNSKQSATHNLTAMETRAFIENYLSETNVSSICVVAADDFREASETFGLQCGKVCVRFKYNNSSENMGYYKGGCHAFNYVETSDLGIMWFDSQSALYLPSAWISLETFLQIEYGDVALLDFYFV